MNAKRFTLIFTVVLLALLSACTNTEQLRVEKEALLAEIETLLAENEKLCNEKDALEVENAALMTGDAQPIAGNMALGLENKWRSTYTKLGGKWQTNFVITFEPGDKCTLTVYNNPRVNSFAYTILVKDNTYDNYLVAIDSLDEGYTIEDLKAHKPAHYAPSFANLISYQAVDPGSTTFLGEVLNIEPGDYYITCQVQGPDAHKNIAVLGPVHVDSP